MGSGALVRIGSVVRQGEEILVARAKRRHDVLTIRDGNEVIARLGREDVKAGSYAKVDGRIRTGGRGCETCGGCGDPVLHA